jgi:hypothetical protein
MTKIQNLKHLMNPQKYPKISLMSFRRKPESNHINRFWTPAFAGVTGLGHLRKHLKFGHWNLEFGIYLLFGYCNLVL